MTALLAITSALLALSGGVKIRSGLRVGLGIHLLTIMELVLALSMGLAAVARAGAQPLVALMVPIGALLVPVSSGMFWMHMRAFRKRREALEANRLEVYVRYLSQESDEEQRER